MNFMTLTITYTGNTDKESSHLLGSPGYPEQNQYFFLEIRDKINNHFRKTASHGSTETVSVNNMFCFTKVKANKVMTAIADLRTTN